MELVWHGHSTWQVTIGETTMVIDPFFDNPHTELGPSDIDTPDYVLLTHGHTDHIEDVSAFTEATVVGTPELTRWVQEAHDPAETIGMNMGGTIECGDAFVTMVQAYHTNGIQMDPERSIGIPTGYVISDTLPTRVKDEEATTFYHTGDTALMSEMRDVIGPFLEPDAVAVPVGDHFTMGPRQAAIAVDWLDVDHAFPMHYGTFPLIDIDPNDFVKEVEGTGSDATVHVLAADEPFTLSP